MEHLLRDEAVLIYSSCIGHDQGFSGKAPMCHLLISGCLPTAAHYDQHRTSQPNLLESCKYVKRKQNKLGCIFNFHDEVGSRSRIASSHISYKKKGLCLEYLARSIKVKLLCTSCRHWLTLTIEYLIKS